MLGFESRKNDSLRSMEHLSVNIAKDSSRQYQTLP